VSNCLRKPLFLKKTYPKSSVEPVSPLPLESRHQGLMHSVSRREPSDAESDSGAIAVPGRESSRRRLKSRSDRLSLPPWQYHRRPFDASNFGVQVRNLPPCFSAERGR
jgi:hypothetical protein